MTQFRIYYNDRQPYNGNPYDAPGNGVQVIARECHAKIQGFDLIREKDFYCWLDETWIGVDIFGLWDYLSKPGPKKVIFGRNLPRDEDYWEIVERASIEGIG